MSQSIKLSSDSTCDLSPELLEKFDITLMPLTINIGERSLKDGVEIQAPEVLSAFEQNGVLAKTAAVSVGEYAAHFKKYKELGRPVVHITISADFSSCYQNALIAAEDFDNVTVIDSRNLSSGHGHIVLAAAELAATGASPAEIKTAMDELALRVDASFLVDTLTYLHKGGRCSSVTALSANLLQLKPCIEVKEGKMSVGKKYRGNLIKCYKQYIDDRLSDLDAIEQKRIFITHSPSRQDVIDTAWEKVREHDYFDEIIETSAGCTVTSHCGQNTLGVLYIRK